MKIKDGGKEHTEGDPYCAACDATEGELHPQTCGVNLCTGLRHAEKFGNVDKEGSNFAYCCDKCGETETVAVR
jgi:hypothetical protein